MIVANFTVQYHGLDRNEHVYQFVAIKHESINDYGIEHYISYRGDELPVNDEKKFFAKMRLECSDFENIEHGIVVTRRICTVLDIDFRYGAK
jgi:hypothetical protein